MRFTHINFHMSIFASISFNAYEFKVAINTTNQNVNNVSYLVIG